jgi:phospholipid/cholesterol/gamma-HCH transport system ATP-binding protein
MTKRQAPAIEFRGVSIAFDEVAVLDDVSLVLEAGRMLVITGMSGAGKSVLMKLAAGLLPPDSGEILIDGYHIEHLDESRLLALRSSSIGLVFQEDALFSGLSVYDNAAFRPVEHEWSEERVDEAVREILTFVGLWNDADKLPEELSIGMRRRLELARALIGWPAIMLFDEPTSGLDPINAKGVMDLIIRARDIHGISSLYVTKELHEIPYLAHHCASAGVDGVVLEELPAGAPAKVQVLVLERGRVAFSGSCEEFEASDLPAVRLLTHPEV